MNQNTTNSRGTLALHFIMSIRRRLEPETLILSFSSAEVEPRVGVRVAGGKPVVWFPGRSARRARSKRRIRTGQSASRLEPSPSPAEPPGAANRKVSIAPPISSEANNPLPPP
ncbi:unnamed protein product [Lepidochelys kempii]